MPDAPVVKTEPRVVTLATLKQKPALVVGTSDMRGLVAELTPIFAKTLPQHLRNAVDRMGSSLLVEMGRNEYVAKSTARSLLGGLIQVAQLGLELGGPLGQCYLVPYYSNKLGAYEAQFMVGYRGLIKLANNASITREFDAHPVYEGDEFSLTKGTTPGVHHRPSLKGATTDEALIGAYSYAWLQDATHPEVDWMTAETLKMHRDRYAKGVDKATSPWKTAFAEMCRKTVLRRLAKRLPMSAEMAAATGLDEMGEEGVGQNLAANLTPFVDFDDPSPKTTEVAEAIGAVVQEDLLGAGDVAR